MTSEKSSEGVRAVERALDILGAFTATDYELSASELLKRVDLTRPTLYRLLYTLEQSGYVISVGEPQKFRLGPAVAHLAHVWSASLDLSEFARPFMERIQDTTGETVALFIPQGAYRLCINEIPSTQPLSFKRGIGYRERIILGASGRAILAFSNVGKDLLKKLADGTDIDLEEYAQELDRIRKRGYAVSNEELIQGAVAIAAPFFDGSQKAAGSIGIFGPSARLGPAEVEKWGRLLSIEAERISRDLGAK